MHTRMHFLISGGTGFIGRHLIDALLARGDRVTLIARDFEKAKRLFNGQVNLIASVVDAVADVDVVVNLAGEPIIDERWTKKRKQVLVDSRVDTTNELVDWMAACEKKPHTFISGSAIGYYGNYPEDISLDETDRSRYCFPSELCKAWEKAAMVAEKHDIRVCRIRTGVVLDRHAGALQRMWLPFKLGLGGRVGTGRQWLSWIHIADMVNVLLFTADNKDITGAVNATAPMPVNYQTFTRILAKVLRRPAILPMPALALKIILGESAELLLCGQKVIPKKLSSNGFTFQYKTIDKAITAIAAAN